MQKHRKCPRFLFSTALAFLATTAHAEVDGPTAVFVVGVVERVDDQLNMYLRDPTYSIGFSFSKVTIVRESDLEIDPEALTVLVLERRVLCWGKAEVDTVLVASCSFHGSELSRALNEMSVRRGLGPLSRRLGLSTPSDRFLDMLPASESGLTRNVELDQ